MALEHQLNEDQRQQAVLAAEASSNKKHLMQFVAQVRELPDAIPTFEFDHDFCFLSRLIRVFFMFMFRGRKL